jgi:hypothetical protein
MSPFAETLDEEAVMVLVGLAIPLGRVSWKGHNIQDAIYYDLYSTESSLGMYLLLYPVSTTLMKEAARHRYAIRLAKENARMHRLYSELMALSHHPFKVEGIIVLANNIAANATVGSHFREKVRIINQRIQFLRAELGAFFHKRTKDPIEHPNGFGEFHGWEGGEEWVVKVSNQMNEFQAAPEEEKRRIKKAMLSGEDTRSWWAYDPRVLGPLMAALRGYLSKPATPADSESDDGKEGCAFVFDELRALHAVQFEEELGRLSRRLRSAATLPGVAESFLEASQDSVGKTYPVFFADDGGA